MEVALLLPLIAVLALALVEIGLTLRDDLLVSHAAREAARAAAVGDDPVAAAERASPLRGLTVVVAGGGGEGTPLTVTVSRAAPGHVPLLASISRRFVLEETVTMRSEAP